jgi:hypothetical protein
MHRLRLRVLPLAAAALTVALGCTLPSLAVAKKQHHFGPRLLVPGKSIGLVYLGEPEAKVHLGPSVRNEPGSFYYRDYSIVVAYRQGRAVAISTGLRIGGGDPNALVTPGQYQTHTHPDVAIGVPMGNVPSTYPQAQCAHHVTSLGGGGVPQKETEDCLLRSNHGHGGTFFAGIQAEQGHTVHIGLIEVLVAALAPQAP